MEDFPRLELVHVIARNQFTCKEDCLVAALHVLMLKDGIRCVGAGDEWPETSSLKGSENLPAGWNSNPDVYSLRYISKASSRRYLLKVVKAGHSLLVNVLDVNEEKAGGIPVKATDYVTEDYTEFEVAYTNLPDLSRNFHEEVLNQFPELHCAIPCGGTHLPGPSKTDIPQQDGKMEKIRNPVPRPTIPVRMRHDERHGIPSIGRGDLDPFSGGVGGGMLADPASFRFPPRFGGPYAGGVDPHGIARGSVPPGARFDPIGPLGIGRGFAGPDPDHLPPPGYDDMFM